MAQRSAQAAVSAAYVWISPVLSHLSVMAVTVVAVVEAEASVVAVVAAALAVVVAVSVIAVAVVVAVALAVIVAAEVAVEDSPVAALALPLPVPRSPLTKCGIQGSSFGFDCWDRWLAQLLHGAWKLEQSRLYGATMGSGGCFSGSG